MPDDFETFETIFPFLMVGACIFIAGIAVLIVYSIVKNGRAAKRAGLDPVTMGTDLQARLLKSDMLSPERSIEARLHELDDLRTRGVITPDEHAAARAEALRA